MGLVTCLLDDSQATFHLDVGLGSNGVERGVGHERWLDWFGEFTGRPLADVDLSLLDGTVRGVRVRCGKIYLYSRFFPKQVLYRTDSSSSQVIL